MTRDNEKRVQSNRFLIQQQILDLKTQALSNAQDNDRLGFKQKQAARLAPQIESSSDQSSSHSHAKPTDRHHLVAVSSNEGNKEGVCDASNVDFASSDYEKEVEAKGVANEGAPNPAPAAILENFPMKLYRMLEEGEKEGKDDIISFLPHGRAFAIHKPHQFVSEIMPKYFTTSRMPSFQRQLNLYGFRRITDGRDKGGYFHDFFLKGQRKLCNNIKRKKTNVQTPPNCFGNFGVPTIMTNPYGKQELMLQQALAAERSKLDPNLNHNPIGQGLSMINGMLRSQGGWSMSNTEQVTNQAVAALLDQQQHQITSSSQHFLHQLQEQKRLLVELERRELPRIAGTRNPNPYGNQNLLVQQTLGEERSRLDHGLNRNPRMVQDLMTNNMLGSSGWAASNLSIARGPAVTNQPVAALLAQHHQQNPTSSGQRLLLQLQQKRLLEELEKRELLLRSPNQKK